MQIKYAILILFLTSRLGYSYAAEQKVAVGSRFADFIMFDLFEDSFKVGKIYNENKSHDHESTGLLPNDVKLLRNADLLIVNSSDKSIEKMYHKNIITLWDGDSGDHFWMDKKNTEESYLRAFNAICSPKNTHEICISAKNKIQKIKSMSRGLKINDSVKIFTSHKFSKDLDILLDSGGSFFSHFGDLNMKIVKKASRYKNICILVDKNSDIDKMSILSKKLTGNVKFSHIDADGAFFKEKISGSTNPTPDSIYSEYYRSLEKSINECFV
jgi:hypothetical protein